MGTLAASGIIFCMCTVATAVGMERSDDYKIKPVIACTWLLSAMVFSARLIGLAVAWGGW
jgi:hypothetical protein